MALILSQKLSTGVTISYFRVSRVVIDRRSKSVTIAVEGYLDLENRTGGSSPVTEYVYDAPELYAALDKMTPLTSSYDFLKTLSEFQGAVDA